MHLHKPHLRSSGSQPSTDLDSRSGQRREPDRPPRRPRVTFRPSAVFTWLFVTLVMVTGPLQLAVPDQGSSAYFSAAGLGGLAVVGALIVAELRRARRMAQAGLDVERVEVGLLRARTVATGEVSTPGGLRRVSWAGPLTLAATAAVLAAAGGLLLLSGSHGFRLLAASALFSAIGIASLAIADLIPAPGSPGSQLIFARAWRRSGRRDTALAPTARAGVISGWALIVAGFVLVTFVSLAGLWVGLIGAAVVAGSRLMLAGARTRERLTGLRATDVMSAAPPEVSSFATAGVAFSDVALPSRADLLIVRDPDGSLGGIVSTQALAAVPGDDRELVRVRRLAIAAGNIPIVGPDEPMEQVLEQLAARPLAGVALVVDEAAVESFAGVPQVVGIITPADVARTVSLMDAANPGRRGGGPKRPGGFGGSGGSGGDTGNPWARKNPFG